MSMVTRELGETLTETDSHTCLSDKMTVSFFAGWTSVCAGSARLNLPEVVNDTSDLDMSFCVMVVLSMATTRGCICRALT